MVDDMTATGNGADLPLRLSVRLTLTMMQRTGIRRELAAASPEAAGARHGVNRHVHRLQSRTCRRSNNRKLRRRVLRRGRLKGLSVLRGNSHGAF